MCIPLSVILVSPFDIEDGGKNGKEEEEMKARNLDDLNEPSRSVSILRLTLTIHRSSVNWKYWKVVFTKYRISKLTQAVHL